MKKIIIHISLIIIFIVIYFLQMFVFSNFTIAGIMPNIFVILMLYIGLYMGRTMGVIYGILYGIFLDIWIGRNFGITSIALALVGLIGGIFDKALSKDNRITVLLMGGVCTIIYEIAMYVMRFLAFEINIEIYSFIKILFVEVIYNIIIIIILYPLMSKTGYEIEEEVKGNRILTKYF